MNDFDNGSVGVLGLQGAVPSPLMNILMAPNIEPGTEPSYQLCKEIYVSHPMGAKMAEAPIEEAQSQEREITIPGAPEEDLRLAFNAEWAKIGRTGADEIIKQFMTVKRVYGIASLIYGAPDFPTDQPIPPEKLYDLELYFNILDPLNTAGSLVLNQDPNAPDFQKPQSLRVAGQLYHPSRAVIALNEAPIYIEFTNSAFGFVGRSVYQRALYPLKSYIQTMLTDNFITEKAGLLVWKMESPGSVIDRLALAFSSLKRGFLKGAKTGNVLSIGPTESIESLDLKNMKDALQFARDNILKNMATAAKMPALMLNEETLAEGFGEGSEDAKRLARYISRVRIEMNPAYEFMDKIVQRRAWNPDFYKALQRKYSDYKNVPYETAFYQWRNAFSATWPNLLVEPDAEKAKTDDIVTKAAIACVEVLAPLLDPENKATAACWLAEVMNERKNMFSTPLELDYDAIAAYEPPTQLKEFEPAPESNRE